VIDPRDMQEDSGQPISVRNIVLIFLMAIFWWLIVIALGYGVYTVICWGLEVVVSWL
jgi:hypothetical protein